VSLLATFFFSLNDENVCPDISPLRGPGEQLRFFSRDGYLHSSICLGLSHVFSLIFFRSEVEGVCTSLRCNAMSFFSFRRRPLLLKLRNPFHPLKERLPSLPKSRRQQGWRLWRFHPQTVRSFLVPSVP